MMKNGGNTRITLLISLSMTLLVMILSVTTYMIFTVIYPQLSEDYYNDNRSNLGGTYVTDIIQKYDFYFTAQTLKPMGNMLRRRWPNFQAKLEDFCSTELRRSFFAVFKKEDPTMSSERERSNVHYVKEKEHKLTDSSISLSSNSAADTSPTFPAISSLMRDTPFLSGVQERVSKQQVTMIADVRWAQSWATSSSSFHGKKRNKNDEELFTQMHHMNPEKAIRYAQGNNNKRGGDQFLNVEHEYSYESSDNNNLHFFEMQEEQEPHVGMILEVSNCRHFNCNDEVSDVDTSLKAKESQDRRDSRRRRKYKQRYELTERVQDELGLVDVHHLDFIYQPTKVAVVTGKNHQQHNQHSVALVQKPIIDQNILPKSHIKKSSPALMNNFHLCNKLPWLYACFSKHQISDIPSQNSDLTKMEDDEETEDDTENLYEKMGNPFAGGSQGEVWRARRRCGIDSSETDEDENEGDVNGDLFGGKYKMKEGEKYRQPKNQPCDDKTELIMKRLKVENGIELLEAGLREVHFGQILEREIEKAATVSENENGKSASSPLFTKYVDHFFRNGTFSSSSHGADGNSADVKAPTNLELWIVFENAGSSLRSVLYTPVSSAGFVTYQHSAIWRRLRYGLSERRSSDNDISDKCDINSNTVHQTMETNYDELEGRTLMKGFLKQILSSAAFLHEHSIVHRDIKPSNIVCKTTTEGSSDSGFSLDSSGILTETPTCVLADFSSAWDDFTSQHMYMNGPSPKEQTDEYAPPEVLFGPTWVPFDGQNPQSYDSWSIGVLALELLLGTPNVFSVDQRTRVILSHRMKKQGASEEEIQKALYLAALSQFCIYTPTKSESTRWPLRAGDPLHKTDIAEIKCTLQHFHSALRARDPLGTGFDSSSDSLLELIWGLLAWNPHDRITPSKALQHEYFISERNDHVHKDMFQPHKSSENALTPKIMEPKVQTKQFEAIMTEFKCPKCGRIFDNWHSCHLHSSGRKHAKFCSITDRSNLPSCLSSHPLLPIHPTSGWCDIQGRRPTIEDFHSIHLEDAHHFYGVFDGHHGNLASKYAASSFYDELSTRFRDLDDDIRNESHWTDEVKIEISKSFEAVHQGFLRAVDSSPGGIMDKSGTTATFLYLTEEAVIVANVGDSRAILSVGASYEEDHASAIQLTVDHVASDKNEKKIIEQNGGYIERNGGIERVNGVMAVSRSIGDIPLASILSRQPHIVAMTRDEINARCEYVEKTSFAYNTSVRDFKMPCFIVLASDGLWDVMNNQEVIDMVQLVLRRHDDDSGISWEDGGAFQEAAQMLTEEAYIRGSSDNIGVCVVALA